MRTARTRTWSIGLLAVLLLVLSVLTAPAEAATARKLTIKAGTTLPYVGSAVTFSGNVSKSGKGAIVKLQRKSGSGWVAAGQTRTTTTAGGYAVKVTVPSTPGAYSYRTLAPRTSKLAGVYSAAVAVTALRRTSATISASASSVTTGTAVTFNGSVTPFVTGTTVTVQKLSAGSWVTAGTAKLSAGGTFSTPITPTASTSFRASVARTGLNAATRSSSVAVAVTPAPAITTKTLPDAARGATYSTTLAHSGGAGTWTVNSLPGGLTLNAGTGLISGTTSGAPGPYAVYPVFTETATGAQAFAPLVLTVTGPVLAITTTSLPDATKGVPYSVTLTSTGLPGTWSSATLPDGSPALPAGLTLNPTTGVLAGTPTESGDRAIYVGYTETATAKAAAKGYLLHLIDSPVITTASVPDAITGTAYSQQLTHAGQAGTWTLKQGNLPPGVTLSPTGLLSGTATAVGDYGFTVTFTETGTGYADNQPLLLHVEAPNSPHINTTELPAGQVGAPYSATLSAVGTGTWSVVYNVPPPGITLNSATGALTGTPNTAADYIFIVKFTTATGSNTKALLIHVAPATPPPAG